MIRRRLWCLTLPAISRPVRFVILNIVAVGSLWPQNYTAAESLWQKRDQRSAFLFVDTRARRVGDLLSVQVNEFTTINEQDDRSHAKTSRATGGFSFTGESAANEIARDASAAFDADQNSNRTFSGSSDFESDRFFTDQITVTVVDILPNRNLLIEGSRTRVIAGEKRIMRISGIVRPDDIELGNIVQSRVIADFKINYVGEGPGVQYTNHGWLGKVVTKIWPF